VAILGREQVGPPLREVLKHKSVRDVTIFDVDEAGAKAFESDCSDLLGSKTPSCYDDPRVEIVNENSSDWFVSRYLRKENVTKDDVFDVIITSKSFLLQDNRMLVSLYNSLDSLGVISIPTGRIGKPTDHPNSPTQYLRENFLKTAEEAGFESIKSFNEGSSQLNHQQNFLVLVKDPTSRAAWYSDEAEVNLRMREQSAETKSGRLPFQYFDGATKMSYKFPSRLEEDLYCRRFPKPKVCRKHGYDPELVDYPASDLEVKHTGVGEKAGRGLFSKVHIPKGAIVGLADCVHSMYVSPSTNALMQDMVDTELPYWKTLYTSYVDGYGWQQFSYVSFPMFKREDPTVNRYTINTSS